MPVSRMSLLTLFAFVLLACALPLHAQVRHCVTPAGEQVFTDRPCEEVGASEQAPPRAPAPARQKTGGGCARSVEDLVFEINGAFDTHDANRLAGVYHWAGMPGSTAYDVLARLDALVQRPLLEVVPVMAEEPAPPAVEPTATVVAFEETDVPAPPARAPVALRVEQTLANGITPSRTVFGLQRHFGCWWIKG